LKTIKINQAIDRASKLRTVDKADALALFGQQFLGRRWSRGDSQWTA
jgi:hypothetical protein